MSKYVDYFPCYYLKKYDILIIMFRQYQNDIYNSWKNQKMVLNEKLIKYVIALWLSFIASCQYFL